MKHITKIASIALVLSTLVATPALARGDGGLPLSRGAGDGGLPLRAQGLALDPAVLEAPALATVLEIVSTAAVTETNSGMPTCTPDATALVATGTVVVDAKSYTVYAVCSDVDAGTLDVYATSAQGAKLVLKSRVAAGGENAPSAITGRLTITDRPGSERRFQVHAEAR